MAQPEFFITPGYGERNRDLFHYSQAVRVGNRLDLAGQGGWNDEWASPEDLNDEIEQAFRNIGRTLATAGGRTTAAVHLPGSNGPSLADSELWIVMLSPGCGR